MIKCPRFSVEVPEQIRPKPELQVATNGAMSPIANSSFPKQIVLNILLAASDPWVTSSDRTSRHPGVLLPTTLVSLPVKVSLSTSLLYLKQLAHEFLGSTITALALTLDIDALLFGLGAGTVVIIVLIIR